MRTRTQLDPDAIVAALNASEGDVDVAAKELGVSARTLYRRMADHGIKPQVRYEREAAAAAT
jgi:transcriptional regulator of acetoin/glycerol metabolism